MAWSKVSEGGFRLSGAAGTKNQDFSTITGADPIAGDRVVVIMSNDAGMLDPTVLTSGYTEPDGIFNPAGLGPGHACYIKIMGGSPDTSVDCDHGGTGTSAGLIQIWRGGHASTLLDGTSTIINGGTLAPDPPSMTTAINDSLVLALGFLDDDDSASLVTAPAGYTNLFAYDTGLGGVSGATVMIASLVKATAGAENPAAFGGGLDDAWFAATVAMPIGAAVGTTQAVRSMHMARMRQK